MTTVITVEPLDFKMVDCMATWMQSYATAAGRTRVRVDYPASLAVDSVSKGVAALDKAIRSTPGVKVVLAHSEGSEVATGWLAQFASLPDAPPASELSFILTGNPQRRLGRQPGKRAVDGTLLDATRDDTQYTVTDIARRYDGWCNWDNYPTGATPFAFIRLLIGAWFTDHPDYTQVSLTNPANIVRNVTGNTTYLVVP